MLEDGTAAAASMALSMALLAAGRPIAGGRVAWDLLRGRGQGNKLGRHLRGARASRRFFLRALVCCVGPLEVADLEPVADV